VIVQPARTASSCDQRAEFQHRAQHRFIRDVEPTASSSSTSR
jgi:hypothetical protein